MTRNDTYMELVAQLPGEVRTSLDELARQGAQRLLAAAVAAEYVDRPAGREGRTRGRLRGPGGRPAIGRATP